MSQQPCVFLDLSKNVSRMRTDKVICVPNAETASVQEWCSMRTRYVASRCVRNRLFVYRGRTQVVYAERTQRVHDMGTPNAYGIVVRCVHRVYAKSVRKMYSKCTSGTRSECVRDVVTCVQNVYVTCVQGGEIKRTVRIWCTQDVRDVYWTCRTHLVHV